MNDKSNDNLKIEFTVGEGVEIKGIHYEFK